MPWTISSGQPIPNLEPLRHGYFIENFKIIAIYKGHFSHFSHDNPIQIRAYNAFVLLMIVIEGVLCHNML
jgi:hypothetical protein